MVGRCFFLLGLPIFKGRAVECSFFLKINDLGEVAADSFVAVLQKEKPRQILGEIGKVRWRKELVMEFHPQGGTEVGMVSTCVYVNMFMYMDLTQMVFHFFLQVSWLLSDYIFHDLFLTWSWALIYFSLVWERISAEQGGPWLQIPHMLTAR